MAGEQSAEEQFVISFTKQQQTEGSEQLEEIPASQNQHLERRKHNY